MASRGRSREVSVDILQHALQLSAMSATVPDVRHTCVQRATHSVSGQFRYHFPNVSWGEMSEITLPSRHRIRNLNPGGLRPSTLPLAHRGSPQYWVSQVDGERNIFVSFKTPRPGNEPRTLAWKAAVLTTTPGPPPSRYPNSSTRECCTGVEFVLKHWEELNVSLLPNDEKTCKQSLIHNWKVTSFVCLYQQYIQLHYVMSDDLDIFCLIVTCN